MKSFCRKNQIKCENPDGFLHTSISFPFREREYESLANLDLRIKLINL